MKLHSHTCVTCGAKFECDGDYKPNCDGFPEAICDEFHERGNNQCMGCALKAEHRCADCHEEFACDEECEAEGHLEYCPTCAIKVLLPNTAEDDGA